MRKQISNTNMPAYKAFFIIVLALLFSGFTFLPLHPFLQNQKSSIIFYSIFFIAILFLYYLFFGRFYKIEIDAETLYFSDHKKEGAIKFDQLLSIKDEALPYKLFFKTAYGITIKFLSESGKVKKIKFLSPETSWGGAPFEIPQLKQLKGIISANKKTNRY